MLIIVPATAPATLQIAAPVPMVRPNRITEVVATLTGNSTSDATAIAGRSRL